MKIRTSVSSDFSVRCSTTWNALRGCCTSFKKLCQKTPKNHPILAFAATQFPVNQLPEFGVTLR